MGPIEHGIHGELTEHNADLTVTGQMALRLAREMDGGSASASALASLSKQLLAVRAEALGDVVTEAESPVERMRRESAARLAATLAATPGSSPDRAVSA